MLLFAVLAVTVTPMTPPATPAQATVRITRSVRVTSDAWRAERHGQKREITVVEDGLRVTVRVIEFE